MLKLLPQSPENVFRRDRVDFAAFDLGNSAFNFRCEFSVFFRGWHKGIHHRLDNLGALLVRKLQNGLQELAGFFGHACYESEFGG